MFSTWRTLKRPVSLLFYLSPRELLFIFVLELLKWASLMEYLSFCFAIQNNLCLHQLELQVNIFELWRGLQLFSRDVEQAVCNPTNPHVLRLQLPCAAQELPLSGTWSAGTIITWMYLPWKCGLINWILYNVLHYYVQRVLDLLDIQVMMWNTLERTTRRRGTSLCLREFCNTRQGQEGRVCMDIGMMTTRGVKYLYGGYPVIGFR